LFKKRKTKITHHFRYKNKPTKFVFFLFLTALTHKEKNILISMHTDLQYSYQNRYCVKKKMRKGCRVYNLAIEDCLYYNITQYIEIREIYMFGCLNELYLPSTLLNDIEKRMYKNYSELIEVDMSSP
jgi:hypothetical protein